jgi:hypothetical protein
MPAGTLSRPAGLPAGTTFMAARLLTPKAMRTRLAAAVVMLQALTLLLAAGPACADDPVKGEVKVFNQSGYVRLLFRLEEAVSVKVQGNFPIIILRFQKPVSISVDRLNENVPDFISAARIDPDGMAIRIALAKKMKVHPIPAAERLYIDLLPEPWAGVLPGLPEEVIEELANRAREAERLLKTQRLATKETKPPTIRVRVASQPTFVRYVFTLPNGANVVSDRHDDQITLNFDKPIKWDLADVVATLPPTLKAVDANIDTESAAVNFTLNGTPKVHTFREDTSIAVDIGLDGAKPKQATPAIEAPETVPAKGSAKTEQPADPMNGAPPLINMAPPPPKNATDKPSARPATKENAPGPPKRDRAAALPPKETDKQQGGAAAEPATPKHVDMQTATREAAATPVMSAAATPASQVPAPAAPHHEATAEPKIGRAADDAKPAAAKPKAETGAPKIAADGKDAPKPAPKQETKHAPAAPKQEAKLAAKSAGPKADPKSPVTVELSHDSDGLRLEFPFAAPTPAAVFHRADMVWLVFDCEAPIDLAALKREPDSGIRDATFERAEDGAAIVQLQLTRPRMSSAMTDGNAWIVSIGDRATVPTKPLAIARNMIGKNRASIAIPFENPRGIHRIIDPAVGDKLMVVTALGPPRGFIKPQEFVELRALPSTQGVVLQPLADDLTAELAANKISVTRPEGLALSPTAVGQQQFATNFRAMTFDAQVWGFDKQAPYNARQSDLIFNAAMAPSGKRRVPRLNLARFYLARGMSAEALGVIDVTLADERGDDVTGTVLKAIGKVMLDRSDEALKELSKPQVGSQLDAPIWRAIALARQGRWADAHSLFKDVEAALGALPIELQRTALYEELHVAIEVRDFVGADRIISELETLGVPPDLQPAVAVLIGRLNQGLGRNEDALTNYRAAAASQNQPAAAQGRLREIMLRFAVGDMPRKDVIDQLESLTAIWRGDDTEVEGLKMLAHLYTEDKRYRDAFHVMRTARLAHANSDLTRQIQDEAATTFESLFLDGKVDPMPPVEALALFYDYRELTPIGRRGDEMIRKLADRLVAVDLLDQAAELLQHQVDQRLHGAARAQVATHLAVIYLMNRKPKRALETLRASRVDGLSNDLRDQRLLLEARALSETGRHDLALEMIANIKGREAVRLRADILWAAKRWRQAAEQIEFLYGERWHEFAPLSEAERVDILRAATGYALGNETLGLSRFRERYAPKMADTLDRHAFEVVTAPVGTSGDEFKTVERAMAGIDTLGAFLSDMRKRYPDSAPLPPEGQADSAGAAPPDAKAQAAPAAASQLLAKAPSGAPQKPEPASTGSVPRLSRKTVTKR